MKDFTYILDRFIHTKVGANDYNENGYLMCGKCRSRKQFLCEFPTPNGLIQRLVPVPCDCETAIIKQELQTREQYELNRQIENLRRDGISDSAYLDYNFNRDDGGNPKISELCKRYVDRWEKVKADNLGILFYGSVGTGKSFFSCAVANALLGKCVPICIANIPRILANFQDSADLSAKLNRYHLLVIDDLGAERSSSYAAEQVYQLIDSRMRSGMPTIINTNLTMDELTNPQSLAYQRIYDRVMEMCPVRIKMLGESKRNAKSDVRRSKAREILGV